MQLSLPIPIFPTPAAPATSGSSNNSSLVDSAAKTSPESPTQCFESFFPKKEAVDDQQSDKEEDGNDPEKDAAILAASFWMPIMQPAPAPQPVLSEELGAGPAAAAALTQGCADENLTKDSTSNRTAILPEGRTEARDMKSAVSGEREPIQQARAGFFAQAFNSRILGQSKFQAPAPVVAPVTAVDEPIVSDATENLAANTAIPMDQESVARFAMPSGQVSPLPFKRVAPIMNATTTDASTGNVTAADGTSVEIAAVTDSAVPQLVTGAQEQPLGPDAKIAAQLPKQPVSAQEKFAVPQSQSVNDPKSGVGPREKQFLDIADKALKAASASVGISVAKPVATIMPSTASARTKSASTSESTAAFVFSAETTSMATSLTIDAPTPISHVREAVAAVISAVDALERAADVQKKSVDLQFNVGHEKLDLRVELRDGVVHTTFRTESPEMNRSLAREWNSVVSPAMAREVRLAEPVFSSSSSNDQSSFGSAGQGSSQQRNEYKAPTLFNSSVKRDFYESSTAEAKPSVSPANNSSQILNALA